MDVESRAAINGWWETIASLYNSIPHEGANLFAVSQIVFKSNK